MNLGYIGKVEYIPKSLDKEIKNSYRYNQILLYCKLLQNLPVKAKSILEVGSGYGGGGFLLHKHYNVPNVVGIDVNKNSVKYSNYKFKQDGLRYLNYSSEDFNYFNSTFDTIISLESSIHFMNINNFFANVYKVLNNDGIFIYADFFKSSEIINIEEGIKNNKFNITFKEDISQGVIESIESMPETSGIQKILEKIILGNNDSNFTNGSFLYKKLKSGELSYIIYNCIKSF